MFLILKDKLLRGKNMDQHSAIEHTNTTNTYTKRILSSNYKILKIPLLMSSWGPYCRYKIINYAFSVLPIPRPR